MLRQPPARAAGRPRSGGAAPEGNSNYGLVPHYAGIDPDLLRTEILSGRVADAMQAATGQNGLRRARNSRG